MESLKLPNQQQAEFRNVSIKREARREKFRRIGAEISKLAGDPNVPDYYTGRESHFNIARGDSGSRDPQDPLNTDQRSRNEIPFGPRFKTPQYERTVPK